MTQGISIFTILTIIFVTLKLAEVGVVATWSWLWVLSPLWIPSLLLLALALLVFILACIKEMIQMISSFFKRKKRLAEMMEE